VHAVDYLHRLELALVWLLASNTGARDRAASMLKPAMKRQDQQLREGEQVRANRAEFTQAKPQL
jgi:hypothetical protein